MKQYLIILTLLLIAFIGSAQDYQFKAANQLYSESKFEEAANAYEDIIKTGVENKEIYFNLGNAYYKSGKLPKALLNFERAKLLDPSDEDILYNLELANSQTVDRIETVGEFFLIRWIQSIINIGSSDFWATLCIICFVLALVASSVFFVIQIGLYKRISFYTGVALFAVVIISWSFSYQLKKGLTERNAAIVMSPSVTVKSSPDDSGTELFVIHEGAKVIIIETLGTWNRIELRDGSTGFLPSMSIEVI